MVRKLRIPTREQLTAPFQSKEAFVDFIKAPEEIDGHASVGDPKWSNKDLEPTPPEHRTWTWYASCSLVIRLGRKQYLTHKLFRYNLPLYWFSNQFSLTGWNTGSSLIAVGLVREPFIDSYTLHWE
jgi:nucleobase:cation symporter-1, NCS1 family